MKTIELAISGVASGYGQVGDGLRQAFAKRGIADTRSGLVLVVNPTFALSGYWQGQEINAFTMWECTRIPELVVETIDNYQKLIVPTAYNLEQFSEYHSSVHHVRLGINPKVWTRQPRTVDDRFRVLCSGPKPGGNDLRKAFDLARKTFELAFPDPRVMDPVPELSLVHSYGQLTEEEMVELFHQHHCYLALSRAEGWHLLPWQMLATGAPVILSENPGHMEWAWLPGCYTVPCDMRPSPIGGVGSSWSGEWWEARVDDAVDQLRYVYMNYQAASEQALEAAQFIADEMTWEHTAQGVLDVLGDWERPEPSRRWVVAKQRMFRVRCLRTDTADIGEARYQLIKGETLEVCADALRVLVAAKVVEAA